MKKISYLALSTILLISCQKKVKAEKGAIDILTNVYFNASKGLNDIHSFHISKLNFSKDTIVELIPDLAYPEINSNKYLIIDSVFYEVDKNQSLSGKKNSILKKTQGAIFSNENIPNYKNRKDLSDTVLFKKRYKRFEVNSPWMYSRFYIYPTDTIMPYSLYRHAEADYRGRLERVDSYNKKTDAFVTLQLIPRKEWDTEAQDFFSFLHFMRKKK